MGSARLHLGTRQDVLLLTGGLVVVHTDPVQLQVAVSMVGSCWVDAVLIADHLPELNTQTHTGRHISSEQGSWYCYKKLN